MCASKKFREDIRGYYITETFRIFWERIQRCQEWMWATSVLEFLTKYRKKMLQKKENWKTNYVLWEENAKNEEVKNATKSSIFHKEWKVHWFKHMKIINNFPYEKNIDWEGWRTCQWNMRSGEGKIKSACMKFRSEWLGERKAINRGGLREKNYLF